jgi:isoquinoline 1-oxidoreductase alpha subunit
MEFTLSINKQKHQVNVDPEMPILWVLRDTLELTDTKYGCGAALCGACTVHSDHKPIRSCQTPINQISNKEITTIQGLDSKEAKAIKDAWTRLDVAQCGWCQSGQMMTAVYLLSNKPHPSEKEIDDAMSAHLCRCGTYQRIKLAILEASKNLGA